MKKSLLRYPGGKTRALKFILPYLQEENEILSPFLGGGIIELNLAEMGKRVYGYDVFPHLVNFWNHLLNNKDELYDITYSYYKVFKNPKPGDDLRKIYYQLREDCLKSENLNVDIAAKFLIINRVSFSGLTLLGGYSKMAVDIELTKGIMERLQNFSCPNLTVECLDFKDAFYKHTDILCYCDPPYYLKKGWLYGTDGSIHKNFDHEGLADLLYNRDKWILSYNNCDEIKEMYKDFRIISKEWTYGMAKSKENMKNEKFKRTKSKELLIFSNDIKIDE
jgi:DNA adenine methylase